VATVAQSAIAYGMQDTASHWVPAQTVVRSPSAGLMVKELLKPVSFVHRAWQASASAT
jgi:hypothetical protein